MSQTRRSYRLAAAGTAAAMTAFTVHTLSAPLPAAQAAGNDTFNANVEASALSVNAVNVVGLNLAEVDIASSTGATTTSGSGQSTSSARNLDASIAGLDLSLLADVTQTAPPTAPNSEKIETLSLSVPGVLNLGASSAHARSNWSNDKCLPTNRNLTDSKVTTAAANLFGTDILGQNLFLVQIPEAVSTQQYTKLVPVAGSANKRALQANAVGSTAQVDLLSGNVQINVITPPKLTVQTNGTTKGSVVYENPVVEVVANNQTYTLDATSSPLNLNINELPGVSVELSVGQITEQNTPEDGSTAAASASTLNANVELLGSTILDTDLFPLSAQASVGEEGINCGLPDPKLDTDKDGLTDVLEGEYKTDPTNPDTDNDGLTDGAEVNTHKTDPTKDDTDAGGVNDGVEVTRGTDPLNAADDVNTPLPGDSDDDGLTNEQELEAGTNPTNPDTDGDGLTDGAEVNTHDTNPTKADTDGGGALDGVEVTQGTDPKNPVDDKVANPSLPDQDNDNLTDGAEQVIGTDPTKADTDGDGLGDYREVTETRTDPLNPDTDNDGLTDGREVNSTKTSPLTRDTDKDRVSDKDEVDRYKTNPRAKDSDNDGLDDYYELVKSKTNPVVKDTDKDKVRDGAEVLYYKTNPLTRDTDKDRVSDYDEIAVYKTNPKVRDTDGDKLDDYYELVKSKTNPRAKDTDGDRLTDGREVLQPASGRYPKCYTNPRSKDSDRDGLDDYIETARYRTNPCDWDTDNGGASDGVEVRRGTPPLDPRR